MYNLRRLILSVVQGDLFARPRKGPCTSSQGSALADRRCTTARSNINVQCWRRGTLQFEGFTKFSLTAAHSGAFVRTDGSINMMGVY